MFDTNILDQLSTFFGGFSDIFGGLKDVLDTIFGWINGGAEK
ncbi:PorACj family cell wall channel-forming small protein [Corynebacterium jeikeium]|nr:PorACj family cell wall channel-forming small protein [Corynebacterium jeikeium]SQI24628.1 Uncharacterised protein [Corynebacterium jeikeium]